ncbi:hypothetical protein LSTR_LSTR011419 [Laodelphax striatellus]|uniref:Uncharacterized protein n=1 Tax=Laodelphax striatellus TaxID=195883 RepID=A0A482WMZ0_LAOST|nr:hypothetical protein LSTR_LSTR011419 [Laodelphax striatellus]
MDEKLKTIERELEQTRNALHWQTKRCNHLVSALTLKLEQRDADVLATQHQRETQLTQIMRALLVLEARLRREQRSIRAQLGSRDALIREQQLEIERLKKMIEPQRPVSPPESFRNDPVEEFDTCVKPDLISSLGIWQQPNKPFKILDSKGQQLEEPRERVKVMANGNNEAASMDMTTRQKDVLINGDVEDVPTKYRQKSLTNNNETDVESKDVTYRHKKLPLESEDVPKNTSTTKHRHKRLLLNGGGTETSLERTPSSSSSSSTLSSTLSSLSSASSVSLLSSSSSILKPSSFDMDDEEDDDDGLKNVDNRRLQRSSTVDVPERNVIAEKQGKKEEKTVKISDIIQVRTHSDDLSECESADSFTIIHDMKKVSEYRNGDVDMEVNNVKTLPSALLHEMQVQSKTGKNEYHDNPVLECVNQILLRDQEEFLEEQRVLRMRETEKNQSQENLNMVGRSSSRDDLTRLPEQEKNFAPRRLLQNNYNDKPPCLVTSSQLSLIGSVNFDEELNAVDVSSREQKSKQLKSVGKRSLIPPALPPKPLRLLSMKSPDFDGQQNIKTKLPSPQAKASLPQKYDLDIRLLENQQPPPTSHPIIIGNASPALPEPNPDSELYVISNSALDDDIVLQIQGRNKKSGKEMKNVLHPEQKGMNLTHALIHFPAGKKKEKEVTSPGKVEENRRKSTPIKNNSISMPLIKVASPVSTLLASVDNSVESKNVEKEVPVPPSVSQIVKRFEHLSEEKVESLEEDGNNALRKNFEEFRLDDMDVICATSEEDNENKEPVEQEKCMNGSIDTTTASVTVTPTEAGVSYENFLEATGLSQKSIMTPSRIFSNNHRNVLKPKDVKHRSRVKAAATISNPTTRYWTEPFL